MRMIWTIIFCLAALSIAAQRLYIIDNGFPSTNDVQFVRMDYGGQPNVFTNYIQVPAPYAWDASHKGTNFTPVPDFAICSETPQTTILGVYWSWPTVTNLRAGQDVYVKIYNVGYGVSFQNCKPFKASAEESSPQYPPRNLKAL